MHGIILAGGAGSRLWPITAATSKQLLPVYDKPMIYYPLSLLMAADIREFSVITNPQDQELFRALLGSGDQWGIEITFVSQPTPKGLPDAFNLVSKSVLSLGVLLILGDNLFYGSQMAKRVKKLSSMPGASIFGHVVKDVSQYGSFEIDANLEITNLQEKTRIGRGFAIPGIYKFDESVGSRTRLLNPSKRGELEITDLLQDYLNDDRLSYQVLDRGTAWLDTGTVENLSQANELIRVIQDRQDMLIGSPDEVAFRKGWISSDTLMNQIRKYHSSSYGTSLLRMLSDND